MIKKASYILVLLLFWTMGASASSEPVFTIYPAYQKGENPQWIVSDVQAGKKYHTYLMVENLTDNNINLKLTFKETEGTAENITILENENYKNIGEWTKIEKKQVELKNREKKKMKIEFNIPKNVENNLFQGTILASHSVKQKDSPLNIATRIGVRVYLNTVSNGDLQTNLLTNENSITEMALISIASIGIIYSMIPKKKHE